MTTTTTSAPALASAANVHALVKEAFDAVGASFERFCLMAGIESLMSRTRFPWTQNWLNRSVQGGPEHDR